MTMHHPFAAEIFLDDEGQRVEAAIVTRVIESTGPNGSTTCEYRETVEYRTLPASDPREVSLLRN